MQSNGVSCVSPVYLIPPLLTVGSRANLRAWAMPTYTLRRARFNTSKCRNASQLTLIIKACGSPCFLHPLQSPIYNRQGREAWANGLTCREQHSSSHRNSSMLIVASWEEINKAIKGDITVSGRSHTHSSPLSPRPPLWDLFMKGSAVWRKRLKGHRHEVLIRDEPLSLGVWVKTADWNPWPTPRKVGLLESL